MDTFGSTAGELINRFRSGAPTSRQQRESMRATGAIRELWWVDGDNNGGAAGQGSRGMDSGLGYGAGAGPRASTGLASGTGGVGLAGPAGLGGGHGADRGLNASGLDAGAGVGAGGGADWMDELAGMAAGSRAGGGGTIDLGAQAQNPPFVGDVFGGLGAGVGAGGAGGGGGGLGLAGPSFRWQDPSDTMAGDPSFQQAAQLRHEAAEAFRAARQAMDGSDLEDDADVAGSLTGDAGDGRDRDAAHHVQFDLDDPLMGDEFTFGQQGRIQEDDGIDPAVANGLMGGNNRPLPSSAHQIVEDLDVAFKAFSKLHDQPQGRTPYIPDDNASGMEVALAYSDSNSRPSSTIQRVHGKISEELDVAMMCLAKRLRAHEQKVGALNLQRDIPAVPGDMGDGDGDELFGDDDGAGDAEAWDDAAADLAVSLPPPVRLNRGLPLSAAQQQQQQQLLLLQQQQQQQQLLAAQAQANGVAVFQHPGWQVPHATVNPVPQWMPQQLAQRLRDPQRMAVLQELRMVHQRWAQLAQYLAMHDHEQARAAALRDTLKAVNSATRDDTRPPPKDSGAKGTESKQAPASAAGASGRHSSSSMSPTEKRAATPTTAAPTTTATTTASGVRPRPGPDDMPVEYTPAERPADPPTPRTAEQELQGAMAALGLGDGAPDVAAQAMPFHTNGMGFPQRMLGGGYGPQGYGPQGYGPQGYGPLVNGPFAHGPQRYAQGRPAVASYGRRRSASPQRRVERFRPPPLQPAPVMPPVQPPTDRDTYQRYLDTVQNKYGVVPPVPPPAVPVAQYAPHPASPYAHYSSQPSPATYSRPHAHPQQQFYPVAMPASSHGVSGGPSYPVASAVVAPPRTAAGPMRYNAPVSPARSLGRMDPATARSRAHARHHAASPTASVYSGDDSSAFNAGPSVYLSSPRPESVAVAAGSVAGSGLDSVASLSSRPLHHATKPTPAPSSRSTLFQEFQRQLQRNAQDAVSRAAAQQQRLIAGQRSFPGQRRHPEPPSPARSMEGGVASRWGLDRRTAVPPRGEPHRASVAEPPGSAGSSTTVEAPTFSRVDYKRMLATARDNASHAGVDPTRGAGTHRRAGFGART